METRISSRKTYLDVLRVMASFLVCYNHSYGYHLFLDQEANGSIFSWFNVFTSAATTMDIPLFFMISGALLLGKQESYQTVWKKRIVRILVLILSASLVTYLILAPRPLSGKDFFQKLLTGTVNGSHWYLFAYLSYLIFLPVLRKIANQLTFQDVIALTALRTFFVPFLMSVNFWLAQWGLGALKLSQYLYIPLIADDCFFCPLMGYYLGCRADVKAMGRKQLWGCGALFLGANLLSSLMTYAEGAALGFSQTYIGMLRYLSAMAAFLLVRYFFERVTLPKRLENLFQQVSNVAIGIFLLEPIVSHYLHGLFFSRVPWIPVVIMAVSLLWSIVCMTVGGSITFLLRKIPGVRKYL